MDSAIDHVRNAIEEFEQAKSKAPLGTGLMIQEVLNDARRLRDRMRNIINDNDDA